MTDRLKIWAGSKAWFWALRRWLGKVVFFFEHSLYKTSVLITASKTNVRISGSIAWIGVKSLLYVILVLAGLNFSERYVKAELTWLSSSSVSDKDYIEQLKLYAQLLTAIFSIYFATIGIILSAGYTRLRGDIIKMLTNEQVGSIYSRILVFSAIFCLLATALPLWGFKTGLFVYSVGTVLTLLSALALFPLGQRLFNFFDLNLLVRSEILPSIVRYIESAAKPRVSVSIANHHSKAARRALEQLYYIDDRIKLGRERLEDNLPPLTEVYTALLLHYLHQKHKIDQNSYWFPRRIKHKQWFLAGDSATSMALRTSSQQMLIEEKTDHHWLENEIVKRMAGHVELALQVGDYNLALKLIAQFSIRISGYAQQFQFDVGMQEIKRFKQIIECAFESSSAPDDEINRIKIGIADTWAALGSNLCLETLRRMITFEKELKRFFELDEWSESSLLRLPAFMQVELFFIVERIQLESKVEGRRLSKPKYVQQLAVQKLLQIYSKILPDVCQFYQGVLPSFVDALTRLKMSQAATQVVLASLHSYKKLPSWFDEISRLMGRYREYEHYGEEQYKLSEINVDEMTKGVVLAQQNAVQRLGNAAMVGYLFESNYSDELPDHFGQVYFELAEACISSLEQNDVSKLNAVLPMFMSLAFLASDMKFNDPLLEVNNEFRLHLLSTVVNDLSSILGFAILYGAYFENDSLSKDAIAQFEGWIQRAADRQGYLKRMILLSNSLTFSMSVSPRSMIRFNWKNSFEDRLRSDGFGDRMDGGRGVVHPQKTVREFIRSNADASHLFFAVQVVPQLDPINFEIDYEITDMAQRLREGGEEVNHEDF